jgi:hypothetical protein
MKPSLTINLVFLSAPSVPILQEKTSTPITSPLSVVGPAHEGYKKDVYLAYSIEK